LPTLHQDENLCINFLRFSVTFLWAFSQFHQQFLISFKICSYNYPCWFTEENLYTHTSHTRIFGKLLKLAKKAQKGSKIQNFVSKCIIEFNIESMSGPGHSIFSIVVKIRCTLLPATPTFPTISKTIRTLQHHVKNMFPIIRTMFFFYPVRIHIILFDNPGCFIVNINHYCICTFPHY